MAMSPSGLVPDMQSKCQEEQLEGLPCTGLRQVSESRFAEQQLIREGTQGHSNPPTPGRL